MNYTVAFFNEQVLEDTRKAYVKGFEFEYEQFLHIQIKELMKRILNKHCRL